MEDKYPNKPIVYKPSEKYTSIIPKKVGDIVNEQRYLAKQKSRCL